MTFEGSYNARPRLSPDGKQLAVVHLDRGNYRIAVVDLQSQGVQVLSQGRQDESPSFAPNGATLIYATQDRGRGVLATVSVDGRVQQRLRSEHAAMCASRCGRRSRASERHESAQRLIAAP